MIPTQPVRNCQRRDEGECSCSDVPAGLWKSKRITHAFSVAEKPAGYGLARGRASTASAQQLLWIRVDAFTHIDQRYKWDDFLSLPLWNAARRVASNVSSRCASASCAVVFPVRHPRLVNSDMNKFAAAPGPSPGLMRLNRGEPHKRAAGVEADFLKPCAAYGGHKRWPTTALYCCL